MDSLKCLVMATLGAISILPVLYFGMDEIEHMLDWWIQRSRK